MFNNNYGYPSYNSYMQNLQNPINPYQTQLQQNNSTINNNLIRVNGIEGAKAYQMSANSTVPLFDGNEDILYVKSSDGAGFGSIRAFKLIEMKENTPQMNDYVSRNEFEQFKQEVINYGKQFVSTTEQSDKQSSDKSSKKSNE